MDPMTTSQPFTLNRADGKTITFPILTPSDRVKYRNEFRLARKTARLINLRLTGASSEEIRKDLNEFDTIRLAERDVEEWVLDPQGQQEALILSMQHDHPNADEKFVDALGLTADETQDAAAAVLGIKLVYKPSDEEKKPDPTTAGTEPIGASEPISSPATSAPAPTP